MIDWNEFPRFGFDDALIGEVRRDGRARVRVHRLRHPVVVLGRGSRPEAEVDLEACRADGVPVLRRRGGGCAVVIDPGNVVVSVAAAGMPLGHHRQHFSALSDWLIEGLQRVGIGGVRREAICDLALGDRKVGGACLYRSGDLLYYTASLLIDPDLERVERYLPHPPREPEWRRGRSHSDFMGALPVPIIDDLVADLRRTLAPPALPGSPAPAGRCRLVPVEAPS